jgi:hypothetical protein
VCVCVWCVRAWCGACVWCVCGACVCVWCVRACVWCVCVCVVCVCGVCVVRVCVCVVWRGVCGVVCVWRGVVCVCRRYSKLYRIHFKFPAVSQCVACCSICVLQTRGGHNLAGRSHPSSVKFRCVQNWALRFFKTLVK